ncbi:peptide deformylase [Acinetobacter sp. MD2(2019)]|uniref:peptide deformylase n=1 Tax=Acinetobacter sp. MD2(2019) TaxID=2605273 RepID=UPI002D1E706A|nr:peptide deformylase [Acinetobacter sp. MD2(2019)]MEB3754028.1 peptide deformylase [Acinetobacter sp. MD2(2019)]
MIEKKSEMTILPVAQRGENILTLKAVPVAANEFNSEWLTQLSAAMFDTMSERNGVGIAAPQVYISKRVIIVASRSNPRYPDAPEMDPIVMVNPEILEFSVSTCLGEEGCLSVPNERAMVERAEMVRVRYFTLQGDEVESAYRGFPARIVQHEIDHLDGVLFVDRR